MLSESRTRSDNHWSCLLNAKGPKACNLTDVKSYEFGMGLATGEQLFTEQLVLAAAWGLGAAAI